ncbi:uncharacterized protein LOC115092724 isoform X4 [Rhinatrema bivittatum]|uniref:uncharacterized protein LOC115092724 isoform X4 n=1 Tax=Rhinatrema bivittatum TaxID=194408 RepID=UPI00112B345F|nr:uncharacterized protein LOC115092724 isoform X4 [Rhinatrema bivittatum]
MGQWQSLSLGGLLLLLLEVLTSANVWNQTDSSFYEVIIPKQLGLDKGKGYKNQVSYMVEVGGEQFIIHLRQKKMTAIIMAMWKVLMIRLWDSAPAMDSGDFCSSGI